MPYKGGRAPLPRIARQLNVDAVLEGTVQRCEDRVRISARLLDARADRQLWADTYDFRLDDVGQLERQVALEIAHEVSARLRAAQETRLASNRTVNPQAFEAYLRGRLLLGERTAVAETGARAYFEEALRRDPGFALAYSGLADCYSTGRLLKTDRSLEEEFARKALALEPSRAEGHASLGIAAVYEHKFVEADEELKRAIALNPDYAMAHHWRSLQLLALGRLIEALVENDRARQLDPFSLPINCVRGSILLGLHEYDRAAEQLELAAAVNPRSAAPSQELLRIHWIAGRVPEALAEQHKVASLAHDPALFQDEAEIAAVFAKAGLRAAQLRSACLRESGYQRNQQTRAVPCS